MAPFPSIGSQPPRNFNYPPPGPSRYPPSYPSAPMNTFNPSYPGSIDRPMIPVPSIGPYLPPSFQMIPPPPSSSFVPPSRTPGFSPPSFRPPPSFDSRPLPGRIERFNPPAVPSGLPPSWVTPPSLPPHLSPSYSSISSLTGSPSAYSLNPPSFRSPSPLTFSLPSSSISLSPTFSPSSVRVPSFSQPFSLSGRAHVVSSVPSGFQGTVPFRKHEVTDWTQPSFSTERSPFLPQTFGSVSGNSSFPQHQTRFSTFEKHMDFQRSLRLQFEETIKIMYQIHPSPERPFASWQTMGMPQFAIQINPQTTLFVDPVAVTECFQRASEAHRWAVQSQPIRRKPLALGSSTQSATNDRTAMQEGHGIFNQFLERTAEMQAREVHAVLKYTGIFLKNTLERIEESYPVMAIINYPVGAGIKQLKDLGVKGALENKAVPYLHEKVDKAYKTNYRANFDPKKDGPLERFVQDLVFDPMNLMFMGMGSSIKVVTLAESTVKISTRTLPETIGKFAMTRVPKIGASVGIEEIVKGRQITSFARDLGFSRPEIVRLQQTGRLEDSVARAFECIVKDKAMVQSLEKFRMAEEFLMPYRNQYLSEIQARELIQRTGIKTYSVPKGVPENFRVKLADKPGGIKYVHPENEGTYIRIMPGKPHSPFPHQRTPYVNQRINGKSVDKFGNVVSNKSPTAHIPIDEFIYRE